MGLVSRLNREARGVAVLIVRLLAFALGGTVSAALHMQLKVSLLWSIAAGLAVYVAIDLVAEHLLFGHVG